MREEIIDIVETFIKLCDELFEAGRIDRKLYDELTRNKLKFLDEEKRIS